MKTLQRRFIEKKNAISLKTIRNFYDQIDWTDRMIGIKGQRGVGKTTLLLQYIKKNFPKSSECVYVSLDHIYFSANSLYEFAEKFVQKGGKYLFLDEVHRYKNWGQVLKNIYDDFPGLQVVFTASSILHLKKANADLSRRAVMYEMPGLSLREFINFETEHSYSPIPYAEIVTNHSSIASEIIKDLKPLAFLQEYLKYGYYAFYLENRKTYFQRLQQAINLVLEVDIPQFEDIPVKNIEKMKQLLYIIAQSSPFKPNIKKIAERTGMSMNTLKKYLILLEEAGMVILLKPQKIGISSLAKPEKIFLNNTNLMYTLAGSEPEKGNVRETFFAAMVGFTEKMSASKKTDFYVNNRDSFEIGGKTKGKKQIAGLPHSFIVKDDIEIGFENEIPLWLFGFLY